MLKRLMGLLLALPLLLPLLVSGQDFADVPVTINPALPIVVVRSEPSENSAPTEGLAGGVSVALTGEVETVEDAVWWQVRPPSGTLGWLPESQDGVPTLLLAEGTPLSQDVAPAAIPTVEAEAASTERDVIVAVDLLIVYSEPDAGSAPLEAVARDVQLTVVGPVESANGERWYPVRTPGGSLGWVPETFNGATTFLNAASGGELAVGSEAVVGAVSVPIILYTEADSDSQPLEAIVSGVRVVITDGPVDVDGVAWWQVRSPSGTVGWVPSMLNDETVLVTPDSIPTPTPVPTAAPLPTVAPAMPTVIGVGVDVQILSLQPTFPLHAAPSNTSQVLTNLPRSTQANIIGGPVQVYETSTTGNDAPEEFIWWQIRTTDGTEGWIQEAYYGEPILTIFDPDNPVNPVICILSSLRDVNIRNGPGTQFDQIASRPGVGSLLAADGQFGDISDPGNHWWQLADGFWIRNDLVSEQSRESCAALPLVSP